MCIAIFSTAHPEYALIVVNNRDEFLNRPTKHADWWDPPNEHVLGGRDLLRPEQGTWLGMTRQGRLAVLTNFREEGDIKPGARSRGLLPNLYLTRSIQDGQSTEDFVSSLIEGNGLQGIGGFSLVCGQVGEPLAVISNRTPNVKDITWITKTRGETVGLSNATFADRSWTKVTRGETLLQDVIHQSVSAKGSKESLVEALSDVLSDDTLPRDTDGKSWESQVRELRKSIFIPAVGGPATKKESAEDLAAAKEDDHTSGPKSRPWFWCLTMAMSLSSRGPCMAMSSRIVAKRKTGFSNLTS